MNEAPRLITVSFTPEEATALAALLDVAVKAVGIRGAREALVIIDKLMAANQVDKTKPLEG